MFKKVLVPIADDHDPHSSQAIEIARLLASEDAQIIALTVVATMPDSLAQQLPGDQAKAALTEAMAGLKADLGGVKGITAEVAAGHAARTILDYAEEKEVDLIVMSSHRPGLRDYFLGSTADRVVRHAACHVHVVR